MQYNNLDDLPYSIRRRLGAPSSPSPSHYSLVSNTPSTGPHNPHNRQVMSLNFHPNQTYRQLWWSFLLVSSIAQVCLGLCCKMFPVAHKCFRRIARSLRLVWNRWQAHCKSSRFFVEQLREQSAEQSRMMRQRLEEQHRINGTLDSRVHALENSTIIQTGAVMAATMEQLDGKHLEERVDTLEGQARRAQSTSADLERMLAMATQEADGGSANETLVRMLRDQMEQILLTTDQVSARVDAELVTLTQRVEAVAKSYAGRRTTCRVNGAMPGATSGRASRY